MAKSLKLNGIEELNSFRRRVIRQHGLERISRADKDFLIEGVDKLIARVVAMNEDSPDITKESFG